VGGNLCIFGSENLFGYCTEAVWVCIFVIYIFFYLLFIRVQILGSLFFPIFFFFLVSKSFCLLRKSRKRSWE
jgi:hypothetical protein